MENKETIKIQKFIASTGLCSRRKAEDLIQKGYFTVNGEKAILGMRVSESDIVCFKGKNIKEEKKEYYLLNKPLGYVCSSKEQFDRPIAVDIIKTKARLVTAGRLDMYTTGAIILTNDGEIINKITHPKNEIEKEYYVTIKGKIKDEDLQKLENGVYIDTAKYIDTDSDKESVKENNKKYLTKKAKAKILGFNIEKNEQRISLIIHEGKNRQVRKMFKELGYSVLALHRNRFGKFDVKNMKPGTYRELSKKEVEILAKIK